MNILTIEIFHSNKNCKNYLDLFQMNQNYYKMLYVKISKEKKKVGSYSYIMY